MNVALALFRYFPHGGMQRDLVATARCRTFRPIERAVFSPGGPPIMLLLDDREHAR